MRVATPVLCILLCFTAPAWSQNPYSPAQTRAIEKECIDLGRKYATYVDSQQPMKVAELFDEHGTFEGVTAKYVGREDIAIAFSNRPKDRTSFHLVSNEVVKVHSANLATVESYYVYYRHDGEIKGPFAPVGVPYSMGTYYDECVRTDDGNWLWQLRKTHRKFARPD